MRTGGDEHPFDIPAVRDVASMRFDAPVTFLVGENGSGKSTLIEAHDPLAADLTSDVGPNKPRDAFFLRAESFFNVAARIDREELYSVYGGRVMHAQSHGESFLALAANRFGRDGLYVLDEPEAALSVTSALAFLAVLARASAVGSQFTSPPTRRSCLPCRVRGYTSCRVAASAI